jgi:hypothetical protein
METTEVLVYEITERVHDITDGTLHVPDIKREFNVCTIIYRRDCTTNNNTGRYQTQIDQTIH